jgi:hypothetical protein
MILHTLFTFVHWLVISDVLRVVLLNINFFLGYHTVSTGELLPTFRKIVLLPYTRSIIPRKWPPLDCLTFKTDAVTLTTLLCYYALLLRHSSTWTGCLEMLRNQGGK